jgi:hypothetical protein
MVEKPPFHIHYLQNLEQNGLGGIYGILDITIPADGKLYHTMHFC